MNRFFSKCLASATAALTAFLCLGRYDCLSSQIPVSAATTSETSASLQAYADEVVALVNDERAAYGLDPLYAAPILNTAAAVRADECTEVFSHTRPDGSECFTILNEYGISNAARGENIAYGDDTPEDVVETWMNSSGHRANILSEKYSYIGVGVADGGYLYWTQIFVGGTTLRDAYLPEHQQTTTTTITTTTTRTETTTTTTTFSSTSESDRYQEHHNTLELTGLHLQPGDKLEVTFCTSGAFCPEFTVKYLEDSHTVLSQTTYNVYGFATMTFTAESSVDDVSFEIQAMTEDSNYYDVYIYDYNIAPIAPIATTTTVATTTTTATTPSTTTTKQTYDDVKGDVDLDGIVSMSDAYLVMNYVSNASAGNKSSFTDDPEQNQLFYQVGDVDDDGALTLKDAAYIYHYYGCLAAGLIINWDDLLAPSSNVIDGDVIASVGMIEISLDELRASNYQVTVPITLSQNDGFYGLSFGAFWDGNALTPKEINTPLSTMVTVPAFTDSQDFAWMNLLNISTTASGNPKNYISEDESTVLVNLTFQVSEDAKPGDYYEITPVYDAKNDTAYELFNADYDALSSLFLQAGGIQITDEPKSNNLTAEIGLVEITPEELAANDYLVEIPVTLAENPGFQSLSFGASWDTGSLTLESIRNTSTLTFASSFHDSFIWMAFRNSSGDYTGNNLCTIQFRVPENAVVGDFYTITPEIVAQDGTPYTAENVAGDALNASLDGGGISIVESDSTLYGDINLDGAVDLADVVLLNKAVAGAVTLGAEARRNADCNSDGGLSANDSMVLLEFLVHLVETLPAV